MVPAEFRKLNDKYREQVIHILKTSDATYPKLRAIGEVWSWMGKNPGDLRKAKNFVEYVISTENLDAI